MHIHLENLEIPVAQEHIQGTCLAPAVALPSVLFVHGWGGSREQDLDRAQEIAGLGCVCLTFDLRGHEATARRWENVNRQQNLDDLLAAYDWLSARADVESSAIAVVGISYGGYLASILTSLRPVRWLALRAPALYKDEGWTLPKRQLHDDPDLFGYRRRRINAQDNRALHACAAFTGDVLIVESEHDQIVPHQVIENYRAAFVRPRSLTARVIAEADHALSGQGCQKAYTTLLINWLTEMVVGAREDAMKALHRPDRSAPAGAVRRA